MNTLLLEPGMPRIYTALAEWIACVLYIYPLKKRFGKGKLFVVLPVAGVFQIFLQELAGTFSLTFWVPGTLMNILFMLAVIYLCCAMNLKDAVYWCASALVTSEAVASLEWQAYCFAVWNGMENNMKNALLFFVLIFAALFTLIFFLKRRIVSWDTGIRVTTKEMLIAVIAAAIIYSMSNIGFVLESALSGNATGSSLFHIRTLVDVCGFCILYIQQNQRHEAFLKKELTSIHNIFELQYEQYRTYKENSEFINRKCHDLKHQIDVIRSEQDTGKRESYLQEMEKMIRSFKTDIVTGNGVLDTILTRKNQYCAAHNINFTCLADGKLLNFLETLDICSIFGNALDNAIEYVEKNPDPDKRMIKLKIFSQNSFLMICLENYCEEEINLRQGFPITTKEDQKNHGYGLKSIRYTIEKYRGTMTLHTENNWFVMRILIPLAA